MRLDTEGNGPAIGHLALAEFDQRIARHARTAGQQHTHVMHQCLRDFLVERRGLVRLQTAVDRRRLLGWVR
ncbi:hypothetical protein D3C72_2067560 [compost metagenome]